MVTRYPTAVQARVLLEQESQELRLTIATNTGRVLDEWVVYGSTELDADARAQVETHLTRAGLRFAKFEGGARHGWHARVAPLAVDPDAAAD
jgi:hypothetical protein